LAGLHGDTPQEFMPDFFSVLKDAELCPLFEEWLKEDLSYENFSFWRAVEDYKVITNKEELVAKAKAIFEK
jgi:Regulator of G protein signaling domain